MNNNDECDYAEEQANAACSEEGRVIDQMPAPADLGLVVSFRLDDETELFHTFEIPAGRLIRNFEIRHDGGGIVRMPFSIHEHGGRYHTTCRRVPDDRIDEVNW
jgi:hypothetical protein